MQIQEGPSLFRFPNTREGLAGRAHHLEAIPTQQLIP